MVSGEATLSAENIGKLLGCQGSSPNPAGGAHRAIPDPLASRQGLLSLHKNPASALGLQTLGLDPQ